MLRTFIFDDSKSQWIEEEHQLLSHDICAILDDEKETLYLWDGPKSSKDNFRKGYHQIKDLLSEFPELNIQFFMVKKDFPVEIENKLESMLESTKLGKNKNFKFSRFTTIRIYTISIIVVIFFPIISFLNLTTSVFWSNLNNNYKINSEMYEIWINNSIIFILITLSFCIINFMIGIIEKDSQTIIFSLNGLIICIGLVLYLNQGVYLFLFQEGSTPDKYLILREDILIFLIFNLIAILLFEIPNIYKLTSFFKTYRKFIF